MRTPRPEMRPELVRLVIYLLVMVPLNAAIVWFTWSNVMFMLNTPSCARMGQC